MITKQNINETLAGEMTPMMKLAYLEFVEERIEELFEALTITEADRDFLLEHVGKKAKKLHKDHPEVFINNQK